MWSVTFGVNAEHGVQREQCGVGSVESGVKSEERAVLSVDRSRVYIECVVWSVGV